MLILKNSWRNNTMEERLFNKEKSIQTKEFAILLMYGLHLYGHLDVLNDNNYFTSFFLVDNLVLINIVLKFASICVPIYLWIAGYGLSLTRNKGYSLKKILI